MNRLLVAGIVVVLTLLSLALGTLWRTGAAVVQREHQRAADMDALRRADDALARRGAAGLSFVPDWPDTLDTAEWEALDAWLARAAADGLRPFQPRLFQGGYYISLEDRFLGTPGGGPPREERDLVDAHVRAALDRERSGELIVERPGGPLALRAGPVWVNGRKVGATWTLLRLAARGSSEDAATGYRQAAALALSGLGLACVATVGLVVAVRRQARARRAMEAELRRSERLAALGTMLAGVAHEVRNPLAGLRATVQLWQRGLSPDDDSIRDLVSEVDRIESLVARLLSFSARGDALELAPGDLNTVVAEAARLARPVADGHGVAVIEHLSPSIPTVRLAPDALLQLLRNLTTNALQAMPTGGELQIVTRPGPGGRSAEVSVRDSGPGLSPSLREHLFEPFVSQREGGTGLGLAIAREMALAHRGTLRLEPDNPAQPGAEFVLTLPRA